MSFTRSHLLSFHFVRNIVDDSIYLNWFLYIFFVSSFVVSLCAAVVPHGWLRSVFFHSIGHWRSASQVEEKKKKNSASMCVFNILN